MDDSYRTADRPSFQTTMSPHGFARGGRVAGDVPVLLEPGDTVLGPGVRVVQAGICATARCGSCRSCSAPLPPADDSAERQVPACESPLF